MLVKFADTYLYTRVERSTVRVKCLAQEHNAMSPARARTRTARSGDERTNHKTTAPPIHTKDAKTYFYSNLYHAIENTANQNTGSRCIFDSITPNLPIGRCVNVPLIFVGQWFYCAMV